jgi:hypothetical protein
MKTFSQFVSESTPGSVTHKFMEVDSLGNHNHIHVVHNQETGKTTVFSPHYRGRATRKSLDSHMFMDTGSYAEKANKLRSAIIKAAPKGKDAILNAIKTTTKNDDWKHNPTGIEK